MDKEIVRTHACATQNTAICDNMLSYLEGIMLTEIEKEKCFMISHICGILTPPPNKQTDNKKTELLDKENRFGDCQRAKWVK